MKLFVGLGNPGAKYASNRHNIGFMAVDEIHRRHGSFTPWRNRFQAQVSEGTLAGEKLLLIKPQTYMNESGRSIGEAMRFYKLQPEDVYVLYDDLDLVPGKFKVKAGGGHGGHNGLRSATAHITDKYRRIRLGIGHPGHKDAVHHWVLGDFAKADNKWLEPLLDAIAQHADLLANGMDSQFANKVTLTIRGEAPQKPAKPKNPKNGETVATPERSGEHATGAGKITSTKTSPKKGPLASGLERLFGSKG
ncbi:aminoacyl-tRNA hydrolase [Polycladidibacter hongkongensis]|uniref:aminoacyl-tRNA hydrolase n=1 Tax=Polycladidibacter hongkongensis TaxID=1647556 RepID=UPI000834DA33|nr:aminoacyl-tRNA hydrolase [Pseudovibrio hongkongensis]